MALPLSEAQKQKAKQYFDKHFKCSNCGETQQYDVDLAAITRTEPKDDGFLKASQNLLPVLMVGCKKCGHYQFYSAKAGGVWGGE